MNREDAFARDFGWDPDTSDAERAELMAFAETLQAERPLPSPGFRGDLGRRLVVRTVPRGVRMRIAALAAGGALLLGLALAGVLGAGPLEPDPAPATAAAAVHR